MENVLGKGTSTGLQQSLAAEGIDDIMSLLSMTPDDIDSLTFDKSASETNFPVAKAEKNLLHIFIDYVIHRDSQGDPIGDQWSSITSSQFDAFRISPAYVASRRRASVPVSSTPAPPASRYTPAELFRRGIKRDPSLFPDLKDEKFNDNWHRSFTNQARAQDVMEVLDTNYVPTTQEQRDLFEEKQKFVYAILEAKVKTDRGRALVREHEHDFDAQAVYRKLKEHHLQSTKAQIDSSTILSYVTSARLGNGDWKGSTEGFITNWQNQVRLYERLVPQADHFSNGQKRIMLQNAVYPIEELRQVKNTADLEKAKTGTDLSYDQYSALLLSAAAAYDQQFAPKSNKRLAYSHQTGTHNLASDELSFDIDSPVDTIQAFTMENQRPSKPPTRVRMPRDRWMQLSDPQRRLWDSFSDHAKATILGINRPSGLASKPATSLSKVNLHEISAFDFLQANLHETGNDDSNDQDEFHDADMEPPDAPDDGECADILVNAARSNQSLLPGDIRRVLSSSSKKSRHPKLEANVHAVYNISNHKTSSKQSLVDRGANGGVAGNDVRVIHRMSRQVDIQGIDNHQLTNVSVGTVGGVVQTQKGPVIAVMHQYALFGKGNTIHAPGQLEWYHCDVNDKSVHCGGLQRIKTPDGYVIPLSVVNGLARMDMRPFSDDEWDSLPHVFLTSELDWDPSVLDHIHEDEQWFDAISDLEADPNTNLFDEFGNYRHRVTVQLSECLERPADSPIDDIIDHCVYNAHSSQIIHFFDAFESETHDRDNSSLVNDITLPRTINKKDPDYPLLRPFFGWLGVDVIKQTFKNTTQYARIPVGTLLKRVFKSANPALNIPRRDEPTACDIVYADTPAVDDGSTAAVLFVGTKSQVTDVYGIKTDKQFVNTLEDNIRERGAPNKLISDRAQVEISTKVMGILRTLFISSWQSEPHQQQQNPAERRYQTIKNTANRVMDRTGAPAFVWLLCLMYVCYLLNHTFNSTIQGVPLTALTGRTVDISPLLRFYFWQKVYYKLDDSTFPSDSKESVGHIVGISEHVGPALTWKVLTSDTKKVIYRSQIRPYTDSDPNIRAEMLDGEDDSTEISDPVIKSRHDTVNISDSSNHLDPDQSSSPVFDPEDLVGRTFLLDPQKDGQKHRARIVKLIEDHENDVDKNPTRIKFLCSINNDTAEEVITYNQLLEYITRDEENPVVWKFRRITSHQGPLKPDHPDYNGSSYNVMVEWENGEVTSEPLSIIAADDPVTCAIYAKDCNLLDKPGWKRFKSIAKRQKKFTRMVNQAKLRSFRRSPKYKYGFEVPHDYNHAKRLDERNGNTRWQDAIDLETDQIDDYETFKDLGHKDKVSSPSGYKKIRVHFVFDVKHDGRHKARLVADGHLTDVPLESVYSGVVSLRGFRLVLFLAELNGLETWATDVGNAYLEAKTSEKVYIVAGPEFGEREGHILVIHKALYGLRTSGARWHDRFADCLRDLGFQPCKAEPDIWIRQNGDIYEYVAVYVDDTAFAVKEPQEFAKILMETYKFKLKGTGPITFHLGMDIQREDDGTLCITPRKYLDKLMANYERLFGGPPKQTVTSPLEKGDHPELDTSELLDEPGIQTYQSLIGSLQWVVSIGRFDVMTAVMTLSSFRAAPRKGHLQRVQRIYGYLAKMKHAAVRIRTDEPDYSDLPNIEFDWSRSIYGELEEIIPSDAPKPLGKPVTFTHYVDANLMHDMATGRSVTGILHLINKTPVDWYSKKQATVETATYGSEFVAARTCVEQIIDLRNTLRYLGVPVNEKSYMFGDNDSVINSSMQIHAKLHKRHTMLSFHRVRECIASGMVSFHFIPGTINPADILSKHWGYSQVWTQLKAVLFWKGDTATIED